MDHHTDTSSLTMEELAGIGAGHIAYVRAMTSDEVLERFPGATDLAPGLDLWALFAADGTPLALADDANAVLHDAYDRNLTPVSIN